MIETNSNFFQSWTWQKLVSILSLLIKQPFQYPFYIYVYTNTCVINTVGKVLNGARHKFIKLDIVEFYPSVSGNLLNKSIEFAVVLYRDDGLAAINGSNGNVLGKKKEEYHCFV